MTHGRSLRTPNNGVETGENGDLAGWIGLIPMDSRLAPLRLVSETLTQKREVATMKCSRKQDGWDGMMRRSFALGQIHHDSARDVLVKIHGKGFQIPKLTEGSSQFACDVNGNNGAPLAGCCLQSYECPAGSQTGSASRRTLGQHGETIPPRNVNTGESTILSSLGMLL